MSGDALTSSATPRVSVVMSVLNGERHLAEAVESLLAQTFSDFELIAVDDASTDATPKLLADFAARDPRVRILTLSENIGLTRALNRGLAAVRGEFVARQDADDVSEPDRLAIQTAYLDANPDTVLLGSAVSEIDDDGTPGRLRIAPDEDADIRWQSIFHTAFYHSSVLFRRSVLIAAGGGYDERLACSQDMELWRRILRHGRGANLPIPLVRYRVHAASISSARGREQRAIAQGLALERLMELMPGRTWSEADVEALRNSFVRIPRGAPLRDILVCRLYFSLLNAWGREEGIEGRNLIRIRGEMRRRLFSSFLKRIVPFARGSADSARGIANGL